MNKDDVGGDEFEDRRNFDPTEFAKKHGLKLVGVDWMTCTPDSGGSKQH